MHDEIALAKVASTKALVELLEKIDPSELRKVLIEHIQREGLTWHQDMLIRECVERAMLRKPQVVIERLNEEADETNPFDDEIVSEREVNSFDDESFDREKQD